MTLLAKNDQIRRVLIVLVPISVMDVQPFGRAALLAPASLFP
jgi:hypothetical protein